MEVGMRLACGKVEWSRWTRVRWAGMCLDRTVAGDMGRNVLERTVWGGVGWGGVGVLVGRGWKAEELDGVGWGES